MSDAATSFRPPWAVVMWVDESNLYIEMPNKEGPPYISKFPRSEGGLSKALHIMGSAYKAKGKPAYSAPRPRVTKSGKGRKKRDILPAEREHEVSNAVDDVLSRFLGTVH